MTTVSLVAGDCPPAVAAPLLAALRRAGVVVRERLLPTADVVLVLGSPADELVPGDLGDD